MHLLLEFFHLLRPSERRRLGYLLFGIALAAIVDIASIASLGPFLSLIANPAAGKTIRGVAELRNLIGITDDHQFVVVVGCVSLMLVILSNGLNAWVTATHLYFSNAIGVTLSRRLLDGYLAQDHVVLVNRNSSELGKNILSEVERIVTGVLMPSITLVSRSIAAVILIAFLMVIDPILAILLAFVFGGAYVGVYTVVKQRLLSAGMQAVEGNTNRFRIVNEAFGAVRELRLYGRVNDFVTRFDAPAWAYARATATSLIIGQLPRYILEPLAFASIVVIVIYALGTGGSLDQVAPLVGIFAFAGYRLMPAFQYLFAAASALRLYLPALPPILEGLALEKSLHQRKGVALCEPLSFVERLVLDGVSFTYPDGTCILKGLNLTIAANTTVGIIGRTGSGKTTLLSIVLGLASPSNGQILIDGVALGPATLEGWRRHLGYVPQDVFLVDDSIAANIALGVPPERIDKNAVERAARLAHVDNFIDGLPDRYDTVVGERGTRLSGGQRQRIGIARALYHDPDVIVFDEATSGLDSETEEALMTAIDDLSGHRTLLIIAHRPTTLRRADVVHLLEAGRIVASGPIGQFAANFGVEDMNQWADR